MKKNKDKDKDTVKAINRNVRSSPRKINLLLKNIRGKKADIAIRDLSFARQRIAFEIKKTVQSAIANAENNNQYDIDNLYVKEAYVGKSIVLSKIDMLRCATITAPNPLFINFLKGSSSISFNLFLE